MDWLQFISSIISTLAWPATILIVLFLFKEKMISLIPLIEKLSYKEFEIAFRKDIQELAEKSKETITASYSNLLDAKKNHLYDLADISPRSAIFEAWLEVETTAAQRIKNATPDISKSNLISPVRLGQNLLKQEIIDSKQMEVFQQLRELRNKAVHIGDAKFHLNEVKEYIDLALSFVSQLQDNG